MMFDAAIVVALFANLRLIHGAAIPQVDGVEATLFNHSSSPGQQALQAMSYLFASQLAGIAGGANQSLLTCESIKSMGGNAWDGIGLNSSAIEGPICDTVNDDLNSTYAITNSNVAHSQLLTIQLLHSFNTTERFNALCNKLNLDLIDDFPAIGNVVKEAVCQRSSYKQMAPQPFHNPLPINTAAIRAAKNTESILFGTLLASGINSSDALVIACAEAVKYVPTLNKQQLNGTAVVNTLCENTEPLSTQQAKALVQMWNTRYYITQLETISNVKGWLPWLCDNVDVDMMYAVGLNGDFVQQQVCTDAQYINPEDTAQSAEI